MGGSCHGVAGVCVDPRSCWTPDADQWQLSEARGLDRKSSYHGHARLYNFGDDNMFVLLVSQAENCFAFLAANATSADPKSIMGQKVARMSMMGGMGAMGGMGGMGSRDIRVPRVSVKIAAKDATSLLNVSLLALISVMGFTHTAFAINTFYIHMCTCKDERFFNRHISTPHQHLPLLPNLTITANITVSEPSGGQSLFSPISSSAIKPNCQERFLQ